MSTQLRTCFNGCSFTVGEGFALEDRHYIYDRLVAKEFNFLSDNIAKGGSSNYTIFLRSAEAIQQKKYNIIFTQWSALNRLWLSPGPDCYFFTNETKFADFKYRDLYLSPSELKKFKNTLLLMNHDYQNIFDLIDYCKILIELANHYSVKLIFLNGIVPWTDDLIKPLNINNLSASLSDYTKNILDFNHRDDDEIILYFSKLQNKFNELDQTMWVNLFDSLRSNTTDIGPEGHHPGVNSHRWMANQISNFLTTNQLL